MTWKRGLGIAAVLAVAAVTVGLAANSRSIPPASSPATSTAPAVAGPYRDVCIRGVPHVRQTPDFCGEACAEMWLRKCGFEAMDQDYVFDQSGLDPLLARGCRTPELAASLKKIGFDVGPVFHTVRAAQAAGDMEDQWKALHADLLAGVPSIVCMHYDERAEASEHFRLVLGYDAKADEVLYHEPAVDKGDCRRMKRGQMLKLWPLKYAQHQWTVIRIRLGPLTIRPASPAGGITAADYAQHMMALRKKIPTDGGFTVVIQPPFVVLGDQSPDQVRTWATATVQWAVQRLKREYFAKDPADILDIWLFRDDGSYRKHTAGIFHDKPSTPFGYYSATEKALIMNVGTGGGTLVHELVHPFMEANFSQCPPWLNEGLGSLYEQSGEQDGRIWGYPNWRLPGLQKALRAGGVPSFAELLSMDADAFYSGDRGTNYAQARYLCYYLQQKGLLKDFFRRFLAHRRDDPSGLKTLQAVLGTGDLDAFKQTWEAFVLKLHFP